MKLCNLLSFGNKLELVNLYCKILHDLRQSNVHGSQLFNIQILTDDRVTLRSTFRRPFQMTTHVDIELSTLSHRRLTLPFELFTLALNAPLPADGGAACFLSSERRVRVPTTAAGRVTAVVYWFQMRLHAMEGTTVSTLDSRTHWRQAAVLQGAPLVVRAEQTLVVDAVCRGSCIDITASQES